MLNFYTRAKKLNVKGCKLFHNFFKITFEINENFFKNQRKVSIKEKVLQKPRKQKKYLKIYDYVLKPLNLCFCIYLK
jgi:hypothetical protein